MWRGQEEAKLEVPEEVWVGVFSFLDDGADLCAVGSVCRTWHRLALDDALWKGLAIKRGWQLPALHVEAAGPQPEEETSTGRRASSSSRKGKSLLNPRLTKGRTLEEGDDERDGALLKKKTNVGSAWKEWYVQTLYKRVKRSMRECEGELEELRWRQSSVMHHDEEDEAEEADEDENEEKARDDRERAAIGSAGKVEGTIRSREEAHDIAKEKLEKNLMRVEIREQEIMLAKFAWEDVPVEQYGASEDDLYLVGGTAWGLVNYMLTELTSLEDPMVSQFLLTHQSFMSSSTVLHMLEEYLRIMPRGYSRDYQMLWNKYKLRPVQNMVIHVTKKWIQEQPQHFRDDPSLAELMQKFIESYLDFAPLEKQFHQLKELFMACMKEGKREWIAVEPLLLPIEKGEAEGKEHETGEAFKAANQSSGIDVLKISAKKLARQLALLGRDLFAQLPASELLDMRWKFHPQECPNVRQLVNFFNMIAGYVASTIVTERNIKQRVKLIDKWAEVASQSFKIQDLTCTMAIVSGLSSPSVYRLKKTRQMMSKSAARAFEVLTEYSTRSAMRAHMQKLTAPAVPYLGVHLSNLSFVSDGYTPLLKLDWGDKTCIHWYYHCMHALAIQEMQVLLKHGYSFKRDQAMIDALRRLPFLRSDDAYRLSRTLDESLD